MICDSRRCGLCRTLPQLVFNPNGVAYLSHSAARFFFFFPLEAVNHLDKRYSIDLHLNMRLALCPLRVTIPRVAVEIYI